MSFADLSETIYTIEQFKDSYQNPHISGSIQMYNVY